MRIALAQLNYIVGDLTGNHELIRKNVLRASENKVDLIIFSELAICGYPPLDLLESASFVEKCILSVNELAKEIPEDIGLILGAPEYNDKPEGKRLFNSAYLIYGGRIQQIVRKSLLPTYDIFDEYRYFEPNREFAILPFKGKNIALTICEDMWDDQPVDNEFARSRLYTRHPLEELIKYSPDFVINIAASPYSSKRHELKQKIFSDKAIKHSLPVIMVNQVGANTELIFEGGSLVVAADGSVIRQLSMFSEEYFEIELDELLKTGEGDQKPEYNRIAGIYDALVMGVRDYFHKSGFKKATLGLSGGIDSALTLAIAVEALGNENLHVLLMPSQYSSDHSISDSVKMAEKLGVSYNIIPIKDIFNLYREELKVLFADLPEDLTEENIQSRIRSTLLMALSNKLGNILLNTSNKSETAVGYGTLYGDMAGGLSVLGDVYKVDVYKLAEYINRNTEIIPVNIINKPPSAELRPGQKDSDSLPEYELLDKVLELYIEKQYSSDQIIREGFEKTIVERIVRMVNSNEYKRYQTPPILRISSKAFGVGRRLPIVGRY